MVERPEPHASRGCNCSNQGRNLIICIDGTSNQFGKNNTNVVELYRHLIKDRRQLTYYNSGVGTYTNKPLFSLAYWYQKFETSVDLAIAWNFDKVLLGAYRWLSENYEENDRIYLFGFSRGAFHVRVLAGMIEKVGLIHKGNEEQIPFAYQLYKPTLTATALYAKARQPILFISGTIIAFLLWAVVYVPFWWKHFRKILSLLPLTWQLVLIATHLVIPFGLIFLVMPLLYYKLIYEPMKLQDPSKLEDDLVLKFLRSCRDSIKHRLLFEKSEDELGNAQLSKYFKETFSRKDVRVHFVGVWDTVSSVGIFGGAGFPLTDKADHICYFRHALALDERRVKFQPEYVCRGVSMNTSIQREVYPDLQSAADSPHVKEVWFAGVHADMLSSHPSALIRCVLTPKGRGGGNSENRILNVIPYQWMLFEAVSRGVLTEPSAQDKALENVKPMGEVIDSLRGFWHVLEYLPLEQLSYKTEHLLTYWPHWGGPRKIQPGQKIHASLAFAHQNYAPWARADPTGEEPSETLKRRPKSEISSRIEGLFDLHSRPGIEIEMDEVCIDKLRSAALPVPAEGSPA